MSTMRAILILFKDAIKAYLGDRSVMYAAGLAYYAVFAIAPLLVFVVSIAGLFIGRADARLQITAQVQYLVGPQLAELLRGAGGDDKRTNLQHRRHFAQHFGPLVKRGGHLLPAGQGVK